MGRNQVQLPGIVFNIVLKALHHLLFLLLPSASSSKDRLGLPTPPCPAPSALEWLWFGKFISRATSPVPPLSNLPHSGRHAHSLLRVPCRSLCVPCNSTCALLQKECVCHPKFICRNLIPNVMVFGGGAFER